MDSHCHHLIANISLACLDAKERHILFPRWGGIESGATLSDEFRVLWEVTEPGSDQKQLVHRCYIDSDDPKDHGCITRLMDHSTGTISFIKDYLSGDLSDSYDTEDSFLENLGMFLGIICHHIGDLCTPVHVGHRIDLKKIGVSSLPRFHTRVERDLRRYSSQAEVTLCKPKCVEFSKEYFWTIAESTYERQFLLLEAIYSHNDKDALIEMTSGVLSAGVKHTADIWHTILTRTQMTSRSWSMQPLL